MSKLTFDEVLEILANEGSVDADEVQAKALDRMVWIAEWHIPGCLSESRSFATTKKDAIEAALEFANGSEGSGSGWPRGMKAALKRDGCFQHKTVLFGHVTTTISKEILRDLL